MGNTGWYSSTLLGCYNGGYTTVYGVYQKSGTIYYYRGSSTKYTANPVKKIYGKGTVSDYILTEPTKTCLSDSDYEFVGWSTSSSFTSGNNWYSGLLARCLDAGYTTVYGLYKKSEVMTYYPQNGESSGTSSIDNYYYGTGSKTNLVPTVPSLTKTNWKIAGWGTTATDTTPDTWATLWNDGTRTVYAIWIPDNNIYFGASSSWKEPKIYYGINGEWKPIVVRYGINNSWK